MRISDKHIRVHEPITEPDLVIVIDSGLFKVLPVFLNLIVAI